MQDATKGDGRISPNVGKTGIDSIRLGGMKRDALPMVEAAHTNQQWPDIVDANTKQEVENIKARYPKPAVSYYESRVVECQENIRRIRELIASQNSMINEYTAHISLCAHRDREIAKVEASEFDEVTKRASIKALRSQVPAYDVQAMETQIVLCREAIERSDEVLGREFDSIVELNDVISKCRQRDAELRKHGVRVE